MKLRISDTGYMKRGDHMNAERFDVLVDGEWRGVTAVRDGQGVWSAEVGGRVLVAGMRTIDGLQQWLRQHLREGDLLPVPEQLALDLGAAA